MTAHFTHWFVVMEVMEPIIEPPMTFLKHIDTGIHQHNILRLQTLQKL